MKNQTITNRFTTTFICCCFIFAFAFTSVNAKPLNSVAMNAYPNPFHSSIIIEAEIYNTDENSYLIVSDMVGKEVMRFRIHDGNNKQEIDGSIMTPGIYLASLINSSGRVSTIRIVKTE